MLDPLFVVMVDPHRDSHKNLSSSTQDEQVPPKNQEQRSKIKIQERSIVHYLLDEVALNVLLQGRSYAL